MHRTQNTSHTRCSNISNRNILSFAINFNCNLNLWQLATHTHARAKHEKMIRRNHVLQHSRAHRVRLPTTKRVRILLPFFFSSIRIRFTFTLLVGLAVNRPRTSSDAIKTANGQNICTVIMRRYIRSSLLLRWSSEFQSCHKTGEFSRSLAHWRMANAKTKE